MFGEEGGHLLLRFHIELPGAKAQPVRMDQPPDHLKQLRYEMDMIRKMGFVDYFLIVSDFIGYAKGKGEEGGHLLLRFHIELPGAKAQPVRIIQRLGHLGGFISGPESIWTCCGSTPPA